MDSPEFRGTEAKVRSQRNGVQPELCRLIVPIHMDVGRLVRFMAIKIHTVRPHQKDGWHAFSISLSPSHFSAASTPISANKYAASAGLCSNG